jgi:hypothetical protein
MAVFVTSEPELHSPAQIWTARNAKRSDVSDHDKHCPWSSSCEHSCSTNYWFHLSVNWCHHVLIWLYILREPKHHWDSENRNRIFDPRYYRLQLRMRVNVHREDGWREWAAIFTFIPE